MSMKDLTTNTKIRKGVEPLLQRIDDKQGELVGTNMMNDDNMPVKNMWEVKV